VLPACRSLSFVRWPALTTDGAKTVSYGLNEGLNPLIRGYFSKLAVIH
jgi:hypothetical protein